MKTFILALLLIPAASFAKTTNKGFTWNVAIKNVDTGETKTIHSTDSVYLGEFSKFNCVLIVGEVKNNKAVGTYQKAAVQCLTKDDEASVTGVDIRTEDDKASDGVTIQVENKEQHFVINLGSN